MDEVEMRVGFNYPYPWNAYGIYLGSGAPPGSNPQLGRWPENLRRNLLELREVGIDCVRMFLLGNAHNYGTVQVGRVVLPERLPTEMAEQLSTMFEAFAQTKVQVIPSLVDFKAWGEPATQGAPNGATARHTLVTDSVLRQMFLEQVLREFLQLSLPYRETIYAWEVQNEPVWNILPGLPQSVRGSRRLSLRSMRRFLREAVDLIESDPFGFPSTVGHRFVRDTWWLPSGALRQFHFYPELCWGRYVLDRTLPPHAGTRAFVGEIGTLGRTEYGYRHGHPWRELKGADARDVRSRVRERLRLVDEKGYPMVLLWPDLDVEPPVGSPDELKLTPDARRGVLDYFQQVR